MFIHSKSHVNGYECTAALISCIDFRFWKATMNYVQNTLGIYDFDLVTQAGGAKVMAEGKKDLVEKVESHLYIAKSLHKIKMFVLVSHQDCGAYGGSKVFKNVKAEIAFHKKEIKKAIKFLVLRHPKLKIIGLFAYFNQFGGIEFLRVDLPDSAWHAIKKTCF